MIRFDFVGPVAFRALAKQPRTLGRRALVQEMGWPAVKEGEEWQAFGLVDGKLARLAVAPERDQLIEKIGRLVDSAVVLEEHP